MGLDYNIGFIEGFLLRASPGDAKTLLDGLGDELESITPRGYDYVIIPTNSGKTYFNGIPEHGLSFDDDASYDSDIVSMSLYGDQLQELHQRIRTPFRVQFCRIDNGQLPEQASMLTISKAYTIQNILDELDWDAQNLLAPFLKTAAFGTIKYSNYS